MNKIKFPVYIGRFGGSIILLENYEEPENKFSCPCNNHREFNLFISVSNKSKLYDFKNRFCLNFFIDQLNLINNLTTLKIKSKWKKLTNKYKDQLLMELL